VMPFSVRYRVIPFAERPVTFSVQEESLSSEAGLTFGQLLSSHDVFSLGLRPPRPH
jgi:hypothetical protein